MVWVGPESSDDEDEENGHAELSGGQALGGRNRRERMPEGADDGVEEAAGIATANAATDTTAPRKCYFGAQSRTRGHVVRIGVVGAAERQLNGKDVAWGWRNDDCRFTGMRLGVG